MIMKRNILALAFILSALSAMAQTIQQDSLKVVEAKKRQAPLKPVKFSLNEDGTNFIQLAGLIQAQMRYNESNPGTTVNGAANQHTWDVGLRRVRFQLIGQLTDRIFFYAQVGENSTNYLTSRKGGFFIHDALGEYAFIKKKLSIGMGLSSWVGPLRYSSPGVGSFMSMDGPIYQQTTNDLNDQFVRRFGAYAKGKLGKLDYRVSISKPFIVNPGNVSGAANQAAVPVLGSLGLNQSTFSTQDPEAQFNTYLSYQFFDQESNVTPYNTGSYYGNKKVFNIGGGIQYQHNAMWHKEQNTTTGAIDTVKTALLTAGVDVFYDVPLNKDKGTALNFYAAYLYSDYGPNYTRQLGVMNTADAAPSAAATANGALAGSGGSAFAMNGSGNTFSGQVGYKFKNDLLGSYGTLMPYAMFQATQYYNFSSEMFMYHVGVNWLLKGQNSKISLDYQDRPYFSRDVPSGNINQTARRGMVVLQYQVSF
jgi:hypothetical protein